MKISTSVHSLIVDFIRKSFNKPNGQIGLHEPIFVGNERKYVLDTIDSTFVSSVGAYVTQFEEAMKNITGSTYAVATVNGTAALHMALIIAGVKPGDEVITQPLTFVATVNAISHAFAVPHFVDVDKDTLGMSPQKLSDHLRLVCYMKDGQCYNKVSGKRIAACIPMHTFGLPLRIDEVVEVCNKWNIPVVEDSTESIGSIYRQKHTGRFGLLGTFSFNGNKTITSGAGGAIITDDAQLGKLAKHLTTTAKVPHPWEFVHDAVGYNYRMPNINAALACAQLEQLDFYLEKKRELARLYKTFFSEMGIEMITEIEQARSNYWLCTIILDSRDERDEFLRFSNGQGVMTRPAWRLMTKLDMYKDSFKGEVSNAEWLEDRIVNIPSSVRTDS